MSLFTSKRIKVNRSRILVNFHLFTLYQATVASCTKKKHGKQSVHSGIPFAFTASLLKYQLSSKARKVVCESAISEIALVSSLNANYCFKQCLKLI